MSDMRDAASGALEFEGRVAIVTGASRGIGKSTAEELVRRGALVAVIGRSMETLQPMVDAAAGRMLAVAGDVAVADDLERLFAETEERFGDCDILINNAGMVDVRPFAETTQEQWERTFSVNVHSLFRASRRALPAMLARRSGVIVNVASISGIPGTEKFPGFSAYNASKGAVISMTEAMAVETKAFGVRVNAISPGSVDTKMWADVSGGAPASMTSQEIAEAILFLASDRSRPMNGQNLHVFSA